jgi:MFS family permease
MEKEYGISREVATIGLTTYVCGLGLGPMVLGPLSEFYGRRTIYLWAFGGFFVWLIPCAVAPDIGSMLVRSTELINFGVSLLTVVEGVP